MQRHRTTRPTTERLEDRTLLSAAATVTDLGAFQGPIGNHPVGPIYRDGGGTLYGLVVNSYRTTTAADGSTTTTGATALWRVAPGAGAVTVAALFDDDARPDAAGGVAGGPADGHLFGLLALPDAREGLWEYDPAAGRIVTRATFAAGAGTPNGPVTVDPAGDLFGTLVNGTAGAGALWELPAKSAVIRTLATFTTAATGQVSSDRLVLDGAGNLFGTAAGGGPAGVGTVWERAAGASTITVVSDLAGLGVSNLHTLAGDGAGHLYAIGDGGTHDAGAAVAVDTTTPGGPTARVLESIQPLDLSRANLSITSTGAVYGYRQHTVVDDAGQVFTVEPGTGVVRDVALSPAGRYGQPVSPLVADAAGNLYGTASVSGDTEPGQSGGTAVYGGAYEVPAAVAAAADVAPRLVFTRVPATVTATNRTLGSFFYEQADLGPVTVTVEDAAGHTVHSLDGASIYLTPSTLPGGTIGFSPTAATVVDGVATYADPKFVTNYVKHGFSTDDISGTGVLRADVGVGVPAFSAPIRFDPPPTTPTPTPSATVSGAVFDDANGNGTRDAGETGVGGVTVFLDADQSATPTADERSTVTADDGTYRMTAVPPGQYALRDVVPAGHVQPLPTAGSYYVSLGYDTAEAGLDFGLTVAAPPSFPTTDLGGLPDDDTTFTAVVVDRAGNLFTATDAAVLERPAGGVAFAPVAALDPAQYPIGPLITNPAGDLFWLTGRSVFTRRAGASTATALHTFDGSSPGALAIDAAGNLYGTTTVDGESESRVWQLPADGSDLRLITAAGAAAGPIAVDPAGDVFAARASPSDADRSVTHEAVLRIPAAAVAAATADAPAVPVELSAFDTTDNDGVVGLSPAAGGDVYLTTPHDVRLIPAAGGDARVLGTVTGTVDLETAPSVDAAGNVFAVGTARFRSEAIVIELPAGGPAPVRLATLPTSEYGGVLQTLAHDAAGNLYTINARLSAFPTRVYQIGGGPFVVPTTDESTPTPTPTPTPTGLRPAVTATTVPTAAVAGRPARGTLRVTVTNATAAATRAGVRAYVADAAGVRRPVGSTGRGPRVAAGGTATLALRVRLPATLPAGVYTVSLESTDGTLATGPTVTLSPAAAAVSAVATLPPTWTAGRSTVVRVTLTTIGTAAVVGRASATLTLTGGSAPITATGHARASVRPGHPATVRMRVRVPAAGPYTAAVAVTLDGEAVSTPAVLPSDAVVVIGGG